MEKVSSEFEVAEIKKQTLRKTLEQIHSSSSSLLLFSLQWKDLEDHFDTTRRFLQEQAKELESKEKRFEELELREKRLEESSRSFEKKEERFGECLKEFELKEVKLEERVKEFELREERIEECSIDFEVKEKRYGECIRELEAKEKKIEEWSKELELKEKRFEEVELREGKVEECSRGLEAKERRYGGCIRELEAKEKRLGECLKELELKEKKIEELSKELELKGERIEESSRGLGAKEEQYAERIRVLDVKEDRLKESWKESEEWHGMVELREKNIEGRSKEFVLNEKKLEERFRELELKEKQFKALFKELELREESIELRLKDISLKEKRSEEIILNENKLGERIKELELKEKLFEKQIKELELREKRFADSLHTRVKTEPLEDFPVNNVVNNSSTASLRFCVTMDGKSLQIFLNERWKEHDSMRLEVATALRLSSDPAKLVLDAMEGFYPPRLKKGDVEFNESIVQGSCVLLLEQLLKLSPDIKPQVKQEAMRLANDWRIKMRVDADHSLEVLGFLQLLASYRLASAFDADELVKYLDKVAEDDQMRDLCGVLGLDDKIPGFIQNLIEVKQLLRAIRFIYAFKLPDKFPPIPLLRPYLKQLRKSANRLCRKQDRPPEEQNAALNRIIADMEDVLRCIKDHELESEMSFQNLEEFVAFLRKQEAMSKATEPALGSEAQPPQQSVEKHIASATPAAPILAPMPISIMTNNLTFPATVGQITAPLPLTAMQQNSGGKRPRTAVFADAAPNTSNGSPSAVQLIKLPHQEPASLFSNQASSVHSHVKSGQLSKESLQLYSRVASSMVRSKLDPKCSSVKENGQKLLTLFKRNQRKKKKLKLLLKKQVDYKSIRNQFSDALQSVSDPEKIVLDAMKVVFRSILKGDGGSELDVSRNFIFLLKQLPRVSLQIKPLVKDEAMKYALIWKSKLKKKRGDHLLVVAFLLFLVVYGLSSSFYADEVLGLLDTDVWRKQVPDLCQVLGLSDIMPNFIQNLIKEEQQLEAIKYICALELVDKFQPLPLLNDHFINSKRKAEELCRNGNNSLSVQLEGISKELASLRALLSYIEIYKHEAPYLPEILEKIIAELERQQTKKKCEYDESNDKNGLLTGSKATSLQQHSEPKCVAPTNKITASAASTINSVNTPESEPQEQGDNKRQKTEVPKEVPPIDSVGAASAFHSTQPPSWQRPVLFMDQRSPHLNTSAGHYSLSGHPPPASLHMNSYNSPNYPEGAIREPVYFDRPPPLGRPGVAIRGPGLYNWQCLMVALIYHPNLSMVVKFYCLCNFFCTFTLTLFTKQKS
ncbi:FRIGIDA-like protein 5 isoform X2 [Quercus suber]|uniref:Frigida-like protein 5 n=1 Tax=Quercus suber TaxID=58331 RepID=A0AAW0LKL0_QUESU